MKTSRSFRLDIQALRGLAVLAVVFFHAFPKAIPNGYLGVDVFFVISGFVVAPLIRRVFPEKKSKQFRATLLSFFRFFVDRGLRLGPPFAYVVISCAILFFFFAPVSTHHLFASQSLSALVLLGNIGATRFSGDYFLPVPNPMIHTWSLSVEEQLYLAIPVLLLTVFLAVRFVSRKTFFFLFFAMFCTSFFLFFSSDEVQLIYSTLNKFLPSFLNLGSPENFRFYSPLERLWEFSIGSILALIGGASALSNRGRVIAGFISLLGLLVFLFYSEPFEIKVGTALTVAATAGVIYFRSLSFLTTDLQNVLSWFGDRSYSIYLWHMPLIFLALYSPFAGEQGWVWASIALTLIFGHLSYERIEKKYKLIRRNPLKLRGVLRAIFFVVLAPLLILSLVFTGLGNRYWGLDRNPTQPSFATSLDQVCKRDTDAGGPCAYPVNGALKTVLLIGDSHAGQYSQVFVDAAHAANFNAVVWTHSSCPVIFDDIESFTSSTCVNVNNEALDWIRANKPALVIVAEYVTANSSLSSLSSALTTLANATNQIALIENNPIFPDGEKFMVLGSVFSAPYEAPKEFKLSQMDFSSKNQVEALKSKADSLGVTTISVNDVFCNTSECRRFKNGKWLYRDEDHLSVDGAALTRSKFDDLFKQIK